MDICLLCFYTMWNNHGNGAASFLVSFRDNIRVAVCELFVIKIMHLSYGGSFVVLWALRAVLVTFHPRVTGRLVLQGPLCTGYWLWHGWNQKVAELAAFCWSTVTCAFRLVWNPSGPNTMSNLSESVWSLCGARVTFFSFDFILTCNPCCFCFLGGYLIILSAFEIACLFLDLPLVWVDNWALYVYVWAAVWSINSLVLLLFHREVQLQCSILTWSI